MFKCISSMFGLSVSDFFSMISAFGTLGIFIGLVISRKTFLEDHRRSRKALAVNLISAWSNAITPESTSSRKLIVKMKPDDLEKMMRLQNLQHFISVENDEETQCYLEGVFGTPWLKNKIDRAIDEAYIQIGFVDALKIRSCIFTYLTQLEAIFAALYADVTDSEMIRKRMHYLRQSEYSSMLSKIIAALGNYGSFSNIERFIAEA